MDPIDDVDTISLEGGWVVFCEEIVVPIDSMLDCDGEETDDIEDVVVVIVQHPGGKWLTLDLRDFGESGVTLH